MKRLKSISITNADKPESGGTLICPKNVPRKCPKSGKLPEEYFPDEGDTTFDSSYAIEKLQKLISDPVTKNDVSRISRLVYEYIQVARPTGFKLKHLPGVIKIFEFLTHEHKHVKEYEVLLNEMLDICSTPPLLEKSSENLTSLDVIHRYFIVLGYLLAALPMKEQFLKVHKAVYCLISKQTRHDPERVSNKICIRAIEQSEFPGLIAGLLDACYPSTYPHVLELTFLLASTSDLLCWKMLEAGALNTILIRMDLSYGTQAICTPPPNTLLPGTEHSETTIQLIVDTLWCLMYSIFPPKEPPNDLIKNLKSSRCAMWGLRYSFERFVCYAQYRASHMKIRNGIAVLLLMGLIRIPSWNLVQCGIANDVVNLVAAIESGSLEILSKDVKFGSSKDELHFQKTLLFIVAHLADIDACRLLLIETNVMKVVLQLVNPECDGQSIRNTPKFNQLFEPALYALKMLAPKIPDEFIKHHGIARLLMILEWSISKQFDEQLVYNCLRCICGVVLKANTHLLRNIRDCGLIFSLLKMVSYILEFKQYRMLHQRILTLSLITIEEVMRNEMYLQEIYEDLCVTVAMKLLFKSLYQRDSDFQVDQRLFLAIGIFIWGCIVSCPSSLTKFLEFGAVYIILDVLEIITYPTQCLYLALLTDICDNVFCGVYLCTWRGIDKHKGILSLLASIWREEEIRLRVRTLPDGSIEDARIPQVGFKQWTDTYTKKLTQNNSPAIHDMIGSTRSKIYSIRKIIERDSQKYEVAREKYKILCDDLPVEDRITLASMRIYFRLKLGQVWVEVAKYLHQTGIQPLGMDSQMMTSMVQRYYSWGLFVKEQQNKAMQMEKTIEQIKERDEYAKIKDTMLCDALNALDELDYILRVTDRTYMLEKKFIQRMKANEYLPFSKKVDDQHCHRTFQENVNVTAIFDQNFTAVSMSEVKDEEKEIRPVSPPDSRVSLSPLSSPVISSRSIIFPDKCTKEKASI